MKTKLNKRIAVMGGAAVLAVALSSCGTTAVRSPSTGGRAVIDSLPTKKQRDRINGARIVSVNGNGKAGRAAALQSGVNVVNVRYNLSQGGSQEVSLKFTASPDRRYIVKYDPFPPTLDQYNKNGEAQVAAEEISQAAFGLMSNGDPVSAAAGLVVLTPAIVLGHVKYGALIKDTIVERNQPVKYVDVMVISDSHSEGVVRRVRAYPGGRVVSMPWDASSNAPSGSAPRGATMGYRQQEEVKPEMFEGGR